jgi:hypothetical protein
VQADADGGSADSQGRERDPVAGGVTRRSRPCHTLDY